MKGLRTLFLFGVTTLVGFAVLGAERAAFCEEPGDTRVLRAKPIAERLPATSLDQVQLSAPKEVIAGSTATVSFGVQAMVPQPREPFWLDIYSAGTLSGEPVTRSPVPFGASAATVAIPARPGTYEIHLMVGGDPVVKAGLPAVAVVVIDRPAATTVEAVKPRLERSEVHASTPVTMLFASPLIPEAGEQYWVTLVARDADDAAYGVWTYVDGGARAVSLNAPIDPGAYEMRLHSRYPALSHNVVARFPVSVVVDPNAPKPTDLGALVVRLESPRVGAGEPVRVLFDPPLVAKPGERFWITVVTPETPTNEWDLWKYVDDGATSDVLAAPEAPGRYEMRLHAHYPTKTTDVIHALSFEVR